MGLVLTCLQILAATFNRANISYDVRYKRHLPEEDVEADIVRFLDSRRQQCGIVYCLKKAECEHLAHILQMSGFAVGVYHGGMKADDRTAMLKSWINNSTRIMVATIAFGMGIDKADVRFVVQTP
jgi:superfamily II DNA helicase RecQ